MPGDFFKNCSGDEVRVRTKTKKTETLISTNARKIKVHSVKIQDTHCKYGFETEQNHLEKEVLLKLTNPKFRELQNTYVRLKDLQINDHTLKVNHQFMQY